MLDPETEVPLPEIRPERQRPNPNQYNPNPSERDISIGPHPRRYEEPERQRPP